MPKRNVENNDMKLIDNAIVLAGKGFQIINRGYILIDSGRIVEVNSGAFKEHVKNRIDAKGKIALPGLINSHIHIGDSIAKELGIGTGLDKLMKPPHGLKHKILKAASENKIIAAMKMTMKDMIKSGITTFVDFRERGILGVKQIKEAVRIVKLRSVILGRPDYYISEQELEDNVYPFPEEALEETRRIVKYADGIGLSSPNEYTDAALRQISTISSGKKLKATHAAEHVDANKISRGRTGFSEVYRALNEFKADFLVHLNYAQDDDFDMVTERKAGVVICPRANSVLGIGFPPVKRMLEKRLKIALGTDNVMINQPDLFREMDYLSRFVKGYYKDPTLLPPRKILRMVTVNPAEILKFKKHGSIEEGNAADIILISAEEPNMVPLHNPVSAIVHRARADNVKLVMINGEIVFRR